MKYEMTGEDVRAAACALLAWCESQDMNPQDAARVLTTALVAVIHEVATSNGLTPQGRRTDHCRHHYGGIAMSRPTYDIEHECDGWWIVTRKGWRLDGEFFTREEAEDAVDRYEREDYEAEKEAREQERDPDDEYGARVDFEFERDR